MKERPRGVLVLHVLYGICCNFNIIFNRVIGPICRQNLHRQTLHHSTRLVKTRLMIELDFYIYIYFPWNYEVLKNLM
jgi:hypothetical protein